MPLVGLVDRGWAWSRHTAESRPDRIGKHNDEETIVRRARLERSRLLAGPRLCRVQFRLYRPARELVACFRPELAYERS